MGAPLPPLGPLPRTARWLRRRPEALAAWLRLRNAGLRTALLGGGALGLLCGLGWELGRSGGYRNAAVHPFLLSGMIAVIWSFGVAHRWDRLRAARGGSWLGALPTRLGLVGRTILLPFTAAVAVVLGLATAALAADAAGKTLARVAMAVLVAALIGTLIGALAARRRRSSVAQSWYTSIGRGGQPRGRPSLRALGYWPVARAQIAVRPKWKAAGVLLILLGVPAGAQGAVLFHEALAATAAWFMAQYLLALLAALVRVAFAAAWWLAPTSLGFARFTLALSYLTHVRQLAACALVLAALAAIAGPGRALPLTSALLGAAGWIALCLIAGIGACAWAYRPQAIGGSKLHRWLR